MHGCCAFTQEGDKEGRFGSVNGEMLPAVGLGSLATFSGVTRSEERTAYEEVRRKSQQKKRRRFFAPTIISLIEIPLHRITASNVTGMEHTMSGLTSDGWAARIMKVHLLPGDIPLCRANPSVLDFCPLRTGLGWKLK